MWRGCRVRHLTSSPAAAHTRLQAVLVAGSALEGFEGIREAVAKHGHLAAMAHWARDEGEVAAGLARPGVLYPLKNTESHYGCVFMFIKPKLFQKDLQGFNLEAEFGTNKKLKTLKVQYARLLEERQQTSTKGEKGFDIMMPFYCVERYLRKLAC